MEILDELNKPKFLIEVELVKVDQFMPNVCLS